MKTHSYSPDQADSRWSTWGLGIGYANLQQSVNHLSLTPPINTSTKLRKYIATISQVLSLKDTEVDWLARHLGHDIQVHRDFYCLHESTIEIAKVSKLLLTVDQGETKKFAGKSLAEIDLNG